MIEQSAARVGTRSTERWRRIRGVALPGRQAAGAPPVGGLPPAGRGLAHRPQAQRLCALKRVTRLVALDCGSGREEEGREGERVTVDGGQCGGHACACPRPLAHPPPSHDSTTPPTNPALHPTPPTPPPTRIQVLVPPPLQLVHRGAVLALDAALNLGHARRGVAKRRVEASQEACAGWAACGSRAQGAAQRQPV